VTIEGRYEIPVITHCCLEPHGQVVAFDGQNIQYWPSTQALSSVGGELAKALGVPVTNVKTDMQYFGGGFGSKFPYDLWGAEAAQLSKMSGGKPVKLFLDRQTELLIGGNRPSVFAQIKVGAKKDGTFTVWQSQSWATGGMGGGGLNADQMPYVFRNVANRKINHTAVSLNTGGARAWRAPNNPQLSYITCSALEDLAAKLGIDALDFYLKNVSLTARPDTYKWQLEKGAEIIEWRKNAHLRGEGPKGPVKRGLGIGVNMWGGLGHDSKARCTINPDGTVEVAIGTQDLGVGTRTAIGQVASESLGLPYGAVKVTIGNNSLPPSNPSGGSTTIGGISVSTRKASVNALSKLFEKVAPGLGATPENLEAVDSRIVVKGDASKSLTWKRPVRSSARKRSRRWARTSAATLRVKGSSLRARPAFRWLMSQWIPRLAW